jgi:hypothetical protein
MDADSSNLERPGGLQIVSTLVGLAIGAVVAGFQAGLLMALAIFLGGVLIAAGTYAPELSRDAGPYLAVVSGVVAVFVFHHHTAESEFYVIAAEVIPLLFLALVSAGRLDLVDKSMYGRQIWVLVIYVLVLGEGFSLYVIATGDQPAYAFGWTVAALVAAAVTIITGAIGGIRGDAP